ncbi:TetR-like C-terminal domain-containing protein [Humibacter ginsenosidimutans]|uniref:TetR/AcrR family transcriptional regulator n=1 Tax=Humibacter ginsenosidimutans TaxID=2599293 RepID=A0A5B8M4H7_9MICO|nr:TetR/AcrR family transcriptional regulator [Humibacter ginsenosidimutans]QDZ15497.1 TetR/AcrR family transcriptional regulator [Humibacter ginsenosidimutans]
MPEVTGSSRPGGRTARTRESVLAAVRQLLAEQNAEVTVPAVAARSGVHATTIYRRWGTLESLLLDVAVADTQASSPVPATGDLRADLTSYVARLLTSLRGPGALGMLRAMLAAVRTADSAMEIVDFVQPRVDDFQAMLDAAEVTAIDGYRLIEIVLAPAYLRAQLGIPLDPATDGERLVDTALAVVERDQAE